MPKFVYIKDQFGIHPQILHDDSVFGVTGDKNLNIIQMHELEEHQCEFSIDLLCAIYPVGVVDAK